MKELSSFSTVFENREINIDSAQSNSHKNKKFEIRRLFLFKLVSILHIFCLIFSLIVFAIYKTSIIDAYLLAIIAVLSIVGWLFVSLRADILNNTYKKVLLHIKNPSLVKLSSEKSNISIIISVILLIANFYISYYYCFKL